MTTIELCRLNSRAILLFIFVEQHHEECTPVVWRGFYGFMIQKRRKVTSHNTKCDLLLVTFYSDSGCEQRLSCLRAAKTINLLYANISLCLRLPSHVEPATKQNGKIPRFIEFCLRFAVFIELFNSDYLCLCQTLPSSPLCSRKNCNLHLIIPHLTHLTFGDTFSSLLLTRLKCFSFFS